MNLSAVMAGLVPAIHVFLIQTISKTWMPGIKPGMTEHVASSVASLRHRRDRHCDRADIVAAVDDLARLVRTDDAGIVLLQHGLLAADDHGQFALEHDINLLRWRSVGARAAARQKMRDADD